MTLNLTSPITHFPVKAGNGTKVHYLTQYTYLDGNNEEHLSLSTACNVTLTNKAWFRRGGNGKPSYTIQPGDVPITCERCLKAMAATAEAEAEVPAEVPAEVLVEGEPIPASVLASVETEGNEFTLHYLFSLADYYPTRKEFRKVMRKLSLEQTATYEIQDHCYILSLPSGFVYRFSRNDEGNTAIELISQPE